MPYFQRRPVEGFDEVSKAVAPMPGLPSRGPARGGVSDDTTWWKASDPATDIVERADAVLAAAPPVRSSGAFGSPTPAAPRDAPGARLVAPDPGRLAVGEAAPAPPAEPDLGRVLGVEAPSATATQDVDGSGTPVLAAPRPVAPGGTARIPMSVDNEGGQNAFVEFSSSDLVGPAGSHIPSASVSFQPDSATIAPGGSAHVEVCVAVPSHVSPGAYSGSIRVSRLDEAHAVLVVDVKAAQQTGEATVVDR